MIYVLLFLVFGLSLCIAARPAADVKVYTRGSGLLELTKCLPERDEEFKIVGWQKEKVFLNPYNLQTIGWVEEIQKYAVTLHTGSQFPVDETIKTLKRRFREALG